MLHGGQRLRWFFSNRQQNGPPWPAIAACYAAVVALEFSNADGESANLSLLAREAMLERGLEPEFPPSAVQQAEQLQGPARDLAISDQRHLAWCSIDNDDSRDLDQLTVGERLVGGSVRIHVAIADVDALVPKGTPLDTHAKSNTTSVYTPARIFPMLPERLSTDLTSLNPHEDRAAVLISFTVESDGRVHSGEVGRAFVRNQARLAYGSVGAWLDGSGAIPEALTAVDGMADQIHLQDEVAQRLKDRRHEEGALDLETIEPRTIMADGRVVELRREVKNRARTLIEDFMIAANGVTARYLKAKGYSSLRRVVRSPERWDRLEALAKELGDRLPPDPDPTALAQFLIRRRAADPLRFPDLSLSVVKLLGRGEYVLLRSGQQEDGHFGLAVRDYVHSTAPNRRYPDLVTQRLLKVAITGNVSPYTDDELEELARHCTQQEDAAEKVERQLRKSAAALLLSSRVGQSFDAIVTGASGKGTWVRLLQPPVEGRLIRHNDGVDVGDRLRVKLMRTDVERGFIDFSRSRR
jgi:exoribonuclease-2